MALKIDENRSATAFHVNDGAFLFPYAADAMSAVSSHPLEWKATPWTQEDAAAARAKLKERYDAEVADAKAHDLPPPAPLPPAPPPLSPADQAALDEYNKVVAEAATRLAAHREKVAKEQAEADQIARDEAVVASLPPTPQPVAVRPQNLSPAQIRKRAAMLDDSEQADLDKKAAAEKKAAEDKMTKDKADADRLAAASAGGAKLST